LVTTPEGRPLLVKAGTGPLELGVDVDVKHIESKLPWVLDRESLQQAEHQQINVKLWNDPVHCPTQILNDWIQPAPQPKKIDENMERYTVSKRWEIVHVHDSAIFLADREQGTIELAPCWAIDENNKVLSQLDDTTKYLSTVLEKLGLGLALVHSDTYLHFKTLEVDWIKRDFHPVHLAVFYCVLRMLCPTIDRRAILFWMTENRLETERYWHARFYLLGQGPLPFALFTDQPSNPPPAVERPTLVPKEDTSAGAADSPSGQDRVQDIVRQWQDEAGTSESSQLIDALTHHSSWTSHAGHMVLEPQRLTIRRALSVAEQVAIRELLVQLNRLDVVLVME